MLWAEILQHTSTPPKVFNTETVDVEGPVIVNDEKSNLSYKDELLRVGY